MPNTQPNSGPNEPKAQTWVERKTVVVVVVVAALTTIGSEAIRSWIPNLAAYAWNVATRTKITYITVAYGDPATAIANADVTAHDPATNERFRTAKTDMN